MRTRFGDFLLDTDRRVLECAGAAVHLTAKAFSLLEILVAQRPRAVPKHELIDRVWPDVVVASENVKNLISELRTALDGPGCPSMIRTIHGFGYAFVAEAAEEDDSCAKIQRPETKNPYPGLAAFTEKDAEHFFGREVEVDAIWRKLERAPRLFALIGPSGAGKSSLLRAGIIPAALKNWSIAIATPGNRPFASLGRALLPGLTDDPATLTDLLQFDEPDIALRVVRSWRRHSDSALMIVDQFEELFTHNVEETRRSFVDLLGRIVAEVETHVLLSMRDDFFIQCHRFEALTPVFSDVTPLLSPTGVALRRAVVQPALDHGVRFEDETLVDTIVDQVSGERGALPLVAFAMSRLWEKRDRDGGLLTRAAYDEVGGVAGALAQHAEATLQQIGPDRAPIVRELFRSLVTAQGTRVARDREELLSLFSERNVTDEVLNALIGARLLTSYETENRQSRVEIIHESLLVSWPRLVHWQTQDAEGAQMRDELRQAAQLWQQHDRADDFLWTGTPYREFQLWRERYRGKLTEAEAAFANAMTRHAQRRRRRRLTAVGTVFALVILVAVATTLLWRRSEVAGQRAESEARRATAAQLLALGQLELDSNPAGALAYATKSLETAESDDARRFVMKALWRGPTPFVQRLPPGDYFEMKFSPNGKWLAIGSLKDNVVLVPSSGGVPIVLGGHQFTGDFRQVEFDPASNLLITKTTRDDPLRIWTIRERKEIQRIAVAGNTTFIQRAGYLWMLIQESKKGDVVGAGPVTLRRWLLLDGSPLDFDLGDAIAKVALYRGDPPFDIDATGKILTFGRGRQVVIRSLDDFKHTKEKIIGTTSANVVVVLFGANQRLLARDVEGEIRVWSIAGDEPRLLGVMRGSPSDRSPRFDPTASRVAAADPTQRVIRIWDVAAPAELDPLQLRGGNGFVAQLDFTAHNGPWLGVTDDVSETAAVWPLRREFPRVFRGHTSAIQRVRFGPDGSWIASGSLDGTVRVWPLDPRGGAARVLHKGGVFVQGMAVDPSGKRVLIGYSDHLDFLAAVNEQKSIRLEPGIEIAFAAAFDRTGRLAALGALESPHPEGMVIRIWNVETGRVASELSLLEGRGGTGPYRGAGAVADIEFAPDGWLYSAGIGGIRRWDVKRGTKQVVVSGVNLASMDLSDDGRHMLAATSPRFGSQARYYDLATMASRTLTSHGSNVQVVALDPTGTIAVTGSGDGTIRVGLATGDAPHLLFGHEGAVGTIDVSRDGRWIASGGADGTVRVWPMPDLSKPPLHTLPHDELLAKLKSLANLRVVADKNSPGGYKLELSAFPGWEKVPAW